MDVMGATARIDLDQPDTPRAKALGVTLMRPRRSGVLAPQEVLLLDEGIAVATYPDDGAVQYETLDALLEDHGLSPCDLVIVERVRGVGRWRG